MRWLSECSRCINIDLLAVPVRPRLTDTLLKPDLRKVSSRKMVAAEPEVKISVPEVAANASIAKLKLHERHPLGGGRISVHRHIVRIAAQIEAAAQELAF